MSQTCEQPDGSSETTVPGKSSLKLQVRGLGHVPSFKNSKRLFLTNKKNAQWMRDCVESFVSQLLSECQTNGSETSMGDLLRSKIASLPHDDNWKIICSVRLEVEEVEPGKEGATVEIAPLD